MEKCFVVNVTFPKVSIHLTAWRVYQNVSVSATPRDVAIINRNCVHITPEELWQSADSFRSFLRMLLCRWQVEFITTHVNLDYFIGLVRQWQFETPS